MLPLLALLRHLLGLGRGLPIHGWKLIPLLLFLLLLGLISPC
jgi:hypothetical protein